MIWDALISMVKPNWPIFIGGIIVVVWELFKKLDDYWYQRQLRKEDERRSKVSDELREFYKTN